MRWLVWWFIPLFAWGQDALRVEVREGAGAVVPRQTFSSRRFTVVVSDGTGKPVQGATVHFRLPAEGPTGTFASGLRTESTVTDARGEATVYGIQWGGLTGHLEMEVVASQAGRQGRTRIPIEVSSHAMVSREDRANPAFKAPSSGKKWLVVALIGAGAAAGAAMAGKGGGQPASYAPPAAVVVPPSIGTPTITVGKP
ncbi:MAG: Ig-like domain-containing protein [Bryobacteraceae bacterium]